MAEPLHSIRAETLAVEIATEALAVALQPRISDLNRQRLLPVIERVLGEVDIPGRHIRIDRLTVDLGTLPLDGLEDNTEAALYEALHQALRAAIDGEGIAGAASAETRPQDDAALVLLAHYLQEGTLPFWARGAGMPPSGFSAQGLVQTLLASDPAALAALIRRIGREQHVLERLVLQLDETALQGLLRLLEPQNAALILAYMVDLRHIQRAEPILNLGEAAFGRLLWMLALSYLLRDAGTQFNRKSFVGAILDGMAESEGLDYRTLVAALARGLKATLRHLPLASSLPAVIVEIARDLGDAGGAGAAVDADAAGVARPPAADEASTMDDLRGAEPAALVPLVRRYAHDRYRLGRLVAQLDEATLQAVLRLIEPQHAALIVAYLIDLRQVHRAEPVVPANDAEFARLLWVVALSYLVRDAGSQFNRLSFMTALLQGLAQTEGLDYAGLVVTLARGLQATSAHRPPASSLPAVINEIVRTAGAPAEAAPRPARNEPAALAALIRRGGGDRAMLDRLVAGLDDATLQAVLRLLEPRHAAALIADLAALQQAHRAVPLSAHGSDAFRHLLWVLTLRYLAQAPGAQVNRKSFMRALLGQVALSEGLDDKALLTALAARLPAPSGQTADASSLPALIEELAHERPLEAFSLPDAAEAVIERYMRREALRFYLRHGVLPLAVLLRRPPLSAQMLLADLPRLGPVQLRALLEGLSAEVRASVLRRLARGLPADALVALVQSLFPRGAGPDDPLQTAVAAAAAAAPHPEVFYAQLMAALLDGAELDLEVMTAASRAPPAPDVSEDIAAWPAPRLVAALAAGLRGETALRVEEVRGAEPDWIVLLETLLTRHPAEARAFLHAVAASSEGEVLLARIPARLFGGVLTVMRPAEAQALEAMAAAVAALPYAERPAADDMRRIVLADILRAGPQAGRGEEILQRVLRSIFGGALDAPVAERMMTAVTHTGLPAPSRAALVAALSAAQENKTTVAPEPPLAGLRAAFFDWLGGADAEAAAPFSIDELLAALPEIVAAYADETRAVLMQHAVRPELRARWVERLPELALARLIRVLEPRQFRTFADSAELLQAAATEAAVARDAPPPPRAAMWTALLGFLAAATPPQRSTEGMLATFLAAVAEDVEAVRAAAMRHAQAAGRQSLVAALARAGETRRAAQPPAPGEGPQEAPRPRPVRARTAFSLAEHEEAGGEPVYIDNAGLVLAGVFLPHLFRTLDMLGQNEAGATQMRDHDTASRAVHLLQYMVDGRCSAPEPLLVLNKIMCGVPVGAPVAREIEPSERERELCDSLLAAMISRWEIIQDSSIAALRETFLQRDGRLARKGEGWELRVERKTLDVLVDRVPWSVSLIFNAWMPSPLHVTW